MSAVRLAFRSALFLAEQFLPSALDFGPRNSLHFAGVQFVHPACDFLLPGCFNVLIYGLIETVDKGTGQVGASLWRKGHGFLQQFVNIRGHTQDFTLTLAFRCVILMNAEAPWATLPVKQSASESPTACNAPSANQSFTFNSLGPYNPA